jgi:hypothetical protein
MRILFSLVAWTLFLSGTSVVWGQTSAAPGGTLLERIQAARQQQVPARNELQARQAELQQAVAELQVVLANSGPEVAEGWKKYLRWSELEAGLNNPAAVEPHQLQAIVERFSRNHAGLESSRFLLVRDRLRAFARAVETSQQGNTAALQEQALASLAESAARYGVEPTSADAAAITRSLAWLETSGTGGDLSSTAQATFNRPNLELHVSAPFIQRAAVRSVDEVTPVNDVILGTHLRGTAHLLGHVSAAPADSLGRGLFCLNLTGTATSCNVGVNGPATIRTTAVTQVNATKPVMIDVDGLHALPTTAQCATQSTIHSIYTKCQLINKMAWKRAGKQKPQAEAIGSERAEKRVEERFDSQVAEQIAEANATYHEKFRTPLVRRGIWPRSTNVSSSPERLSIQVLHMSAGQIGAPLPPHALTQPHDLMIKAHETWVANLVSDVIGGFQLTDENIVELLRENKLEVPEELQVTDESEPWSITFASVQPVTVAIEGNQLRIGIRATRFTKGEQDDGTPEQELKNVIEITGAYKLFQGKEGVVLQRDGDLTVDYVGLAKLSAFQVATKTFLRRKFGAILKPEFIGEGLKLGADSPLRGKLAVREASAYRGWLVVGLDQREADAAE